jgi:surface protein
MLAQEPYAVLSDNNTVLTFYYDDQKAARNGMSVGPFGQASERGWADACPTIVSVVFHSSFADCTTLTSTFCWFRECSNLTSITGIENLKTDNVTNMRDMFQGCSSLTAVDVSGFNTENVTDMGQMFHSCSSLTSLDVSGFNTSQVEAMDRMFVDCTNLTTLDVSHFDTQKVMSTGYMFYGCSGLTSLNLTNFDTQNNTWMESMFQGCSGLTSLDLSNFKTDKVSYLNAMFSGCSNLTTIYVGDDWSFASLEMGEGMFNECLSLVGGAGTHYDPDHVDYTYARIDGGPNSQSPGYFTYMDAPADIIVVDLIENGNMEGENNISYWYRNNLESAVPDTVAIANGVGVNGSRGIKIEATAKEKEMYDNQFWFRLNQPVSEGSRIRVSFDYRADKEAEVNVEAHAEPTVYINGFMFDEDYMTFTPEWQHYTYESEMFPEKSSDQQPMRSVAFTLNRFAEANNYYFDNVKFEVILDWQCPKPTFTRNFNTVNIQSPFDAKIYYTTDGSEPNTHSAVYTEPLALTQATTIKAMAIVEGKDASPVATYAFEVMPEPYTVLSDNNTKVTFYYDKNRAEREGIALGTSDEWGNHVSEITTAVFDNSFADYTSLTSTARWFNRLNNLKTITGLDKVKTDNVRDMEAMFAECSSLTDLDVSTFVTKNVKNMRYMFYNCSGMRRLDLTNFNTGKLTDMYRMFNGCFAMRVIFAGQDWTTENVTSGEEVFNDCTNIVGGETTTYSADHTDYTYARIDGGYGTDKAGYFTLKGKFEAKKLMLQDQLAYIMDFVEKTAHVLLEKDPEYEADELWAQYKELQSSTYAVHEEIYMAETSIDLLKCEDYLAYIMATADKWAHQVEEYQPGTPGEWHDGDEFTDITAEGITMTFRIISVAQNTCQVGPKPSNSWPHPVAIDNTITGHVTIPSKAQGFDVITIGEDAFNGCDITSVDIPTSVTKIDAEAFSYCRKLEKADIPNTVTAIGAYAFDHCAFTSVVIPSSVRAMGEYYNRNPFTGCPNIQSITVEAGNEVFDSRENCNAIIEKASNTIFTGCSNTVIPRSVKAIADYAYYGCIGLTALMIPSNIESIASQSFARCSNLATIQVELDNPVYDSRIGCNAIVEKATNKLVLGCKNTFVPTSVTTIGEYSFYGSGIAAINIPDNVKEIEGYAFMSCEALSSVRLPSELTELSTAVFYGCTSLKTLEIPETVTRIGDLAFQDGDLESIVIPSNVTIVDFQGFIDNKNLQSVTFGQSVSTFGHLAFYRCDKIRTITSYIKTPPVATEAHFGSAVYEQATLYVPYGTRERYLAMEGWNQFQNIVEMPNTEPEPYGVLTGDNTTLRLYYDEQRDIRKGMLITPTMTREPWYEKRGSIMRVVVDETYASNITDETKFWLSDYPMLAAVQAGNAEIPAAQYRGIQNPNVLVYVNEDRLAPEGIQNVVVNGVAQEIVLKDASGNNNWYCPQEFQAEKISYTRNFKQQTRIGYSRGWESLALPFAVQTITHQDKGVIAPFGSDASDLHFWLRRLTHNGLQGVQTIEANTPYIISMPNSYEYPERFNLSGQVTFAAENVTVPQTIDVTDESEEFIMAPAFQSMAIQPDIYALNVGEKREYYAAGSVFERNYREMRPFEAYTMHKGSSPAPMYFIIGENTDDNTTDILEVRSQTEEGNGEWYDLQGRKLGSTFIATPHSQGENVQRSTLKKGVYIQNGRKVIVK